MRIPGFAFPISASDNYPFVVGVAEDWVSSGTDTGLVSTVNVPECRAGDVGILVVVAAGTGTVGFSAFPSGWTLTENSASAGSRGHGVLAFVRTMTGAETTASCTATTCRQLSMAMQIWRNTSGFGADMLTKDSLTANQVAATVKNSGLAIFGKFSNLGASPPTITSIPAGTEEDLQEATTNSYASRIYIGHQRKIAAGGSGSKAFTLASGFDKSSIYLATLLPL